MTLYRRNPHLHIINTPNGQPDYQDDEYVEEEECMDADEVNFVHILAKRDEEVVLCVVEDVQIKIEFNLLKPIPRHIVV